MFSLIPFFIVQRSFVKWFLHINVNQLFLLFSMYIRAKQFVIIKIMFYFLCDFWFILVIKWIISYFKILIKKLSCCWCWCPCWSNENSKTFSTGSFLSWTRNFYSWFMNCCFRKFNFLLLFFSFSLRTKLKPVLSFIGAAFQIIILRLSQ